MNDGMSDTARGSRTRRDLIALGLGAIAAACGAGRARAQQTFSLRRIELVFHHGKPDITVPLRYPDLRVYATLQFVGSGLLQARWKVDGRIIGSVTESILFGETLIFASPRTPTSALPTIEPGIHRATLEVTQPPPAFKLPELTYFVTAEDWEEFRKKRESS